MKVHSGEPSPTAGLELGARVDPLHPPRPFGDDLPPETFWRRHFVAIALATFCTAAAVLVVQQVGLKGLIGFAPQSTLPPSVKQQDKAAQAKFLPTVQHIFAVTNEAIQQRNPGLLSEVYTSTCQCLAQGEAHINQLLSEHEVLGGIGTQLIDIEVLEVKPKVVLLSVNDKVPPYPILNEQGQQVAQDPGQDQQTFTMDLALTNGVWKVSDVVALDDTLP
ncbi:MAG TPA: hypothetical protein VHA57_03070 [Actinomycetota bacterium]|nr:hypothetical protein [Actinomycetota bacterium]